MHYIRFLKAPRCTKGERGKTNIAATITVTTDLGESFLSEEVGLCVELEDGEGKTLADAEFLWQAKNGYSGLVVEISVGTKMLGGGARMVVRPKEERYAVDNFSAALGHRGKRDGEWIEDEGGIVAVRSMDLNSAETGMVERIFNLGEDREIHIWEETGHSIARHIWDAGLLLSAYLATVYAPTPNPLRQTPLPHLPTIQTTFARNNLNVLELGAGCGIVGLTLSHLLPNINKITLTDLPAASSILSKNLSSLSPCSTNTQIKLQHTILDWSLPLPPAIAFTSWDLILVADCTYNPDVVPDLVATLERLADGNGDGEGNKEVTVLLAMKVRHVSEMVFFELMEQGGWVVRESCKVGLPVLGGEGEEVEVFVFGRVAGGEEEMDR